MKGSWCWRVRSAVIGSGTFFCVIEGADRTYVRSEVRRWLAPFGVVFLVPLHHLGDYIQCVSCGQSYTEEVLEILTTGELSERLEQASVALLTLIAVRGGDTDRHRVAAERELRRFVRQPFAASLAVPPPELLEAVERLSSLVAHLEPTGCRDVFAAAVRVAHAAGPLNSANFAALHAAGGALRLPMPTVRSLIVSAGAPAD